MAVLTDHTGGAVSAAQTLGMVSRVAEIAGRYTLLRYGDYPSYGLPMMSMYGMREEEVAALPSAWATPRKVQGLGVMTRCAEDGPVREQSGAVQSIVQDQDVFPWLQDGIGIGTPFRHPVKTR